MEFERAIYRVYEKCLEGLREEGPDSLSPRSCHMIERFVLAVSVFLLLCLCYLHILFVGSAGCLPNLLAMQPNPFSDHSHNFSMLNFTAANLRHDQILQINVRGSFSDSKYARSGSDDQGEEVSLLGGSNHLLEYYFSRQTSYPRRKLFHESTTSKSSLLGILPILHTEYNTSSPSYSLRNPFKLTRTFDFEFAFNVGILALPDDIRRSHSFKAFNVTLSGEECFGNSFAMSLLPLGGVDTVVKNFIQNTFKKEGALVTALGDYYTWSKQDVELYELSFLDKMSYKISVLVMSIFSFFLVSTVTALLVRILISSGVVLLFPMFWLIQRAGVSAISWRLVSLSYPWIGIPIELMRTRQQSAVPFVMAHVMRIVVYYSLYEATQFAFSSWFFGEIRPGQRELWLFAVMMLLEYYSMIYVRSRSSIILFPRFCFALYLLLHIYIYCQPSGFHLLAILVMFMFFVWMMIFCVRKFELDAYTNGYVSIDHPRVLHNSIPWPVWSIALAPDFTLFWPLDSESTSIYGQPTDSTVNADEPVANNRTNFVRDVEIGSIRTTTQGNSFTNTDESLRLQRRPGDSNYTSIPLNSGHGLSESNDILREDQSTSPLSTARRR